MIRSEYWPTPSAHKQYVLNRIPRGAHYDPADDGPEVDVIKRINANNVLLNYKPELAKLVRDVSESSAEDVFAKLRYIQVAREAFKG